MTPEQYDKLLETVVEIRVKVSRLEGALPRYDADIQRLDSDVRNLTIDATAIKTKIGLWSTIAGMLTGGGVSLIVMFLGQ